MPETNAERLGEIKNSIEWAEIYKAEGSYGALTATLERLFNNGNVDWLIEQAERAQELENSTTVHVIKRRNGKATIIGWNGERYVYQSDSTARGGVSRGKR